MIRFLILLGYFEMTMYLHLTGKLNQYINLNYSYLTYLSMFLSFVLAIIQLIIWVKKIQTHSHLVKRSAQISSIVFLLLPIIVAVGFPTVSLDATTVSAKGYSFPLAAENDPATQEQEGTSTQYLRPDSSSFFTKSGYKKEMQKSLDKYKNQDSITLTTENYMEVMELIYDFPELFIGKTITMTGFVYRDPDKPDHLFLFRFGIIHCIADSGVYGLVTTGSQNRYPNNTWLTATGTISLSYHQSLNQSLPTLVIQEVHEVEQPDNPYVYRVF